MFKHILIPTDGSDLSNMAVSKGVQFAKEIGARITGLTVTVPPHYLTPNSVYVAESEEFYSKNMQQQAQRTLQILQDEAAQQGVRCEVLHNVSDHPYEEIVKTAESTGCDAIFMASHGRRGVRGLLMGSETHKVLTHTKIPVVVFR